MFQCMRFTIASTSGFSTRSVCSHWVSPHPDPSVQANVLSHYAPKLAEADNMFAYRLNAYWVSKNLHVAVTQFQVDELRRYLVSEAREVHGSTAKGIRQEGFDG